LKFDKIEKVSLFAKTLKQEKLIFENFFFAKCFSSSQTKIALKFPSANFRLNANFQAKYRLSESKNEWAI